MEQIHKHGGRSSESRFDRTIILKALNVLQGQNILDAGCGNGYMAKEFSRLVTDSGTIYAMDIYEESIEQLKKETEATNITASLGDITKKTQIEDSSIDLIYLSTVFHGFTDSQKEGFLREVKRILKPGGILAVVEINKSNTPFGPPMDIRYSPQELSESIGLNKLSFIKIGDNFYMQTFVYDS